jgi:hypothetical protein
MTIQNHDLSARDSRFEIYEYEVGNRTEDFLRNTQDSGTCASVRTVGGNSFFHEIPYFTLTNYWPHYDLLVHRKEQYNEMDLSSL